MYTRRSSKYGSHQAIHFENSETGNAFSIIPELGANIYKLQLSNGEKHFSVIDGPEAHELDANTFYKSTFLLPFPNRVKHGKYSFEGKTYQLPVNEPALNNALHGFICQRKFDVTAEKLASDFAIVTLKNFYLGDYEGYPFPFETTIEILLSDQDGLTIRIEAKNTTTQKLPIGIGWHPYFSFGHDIGDVLVITPQCTEIVVDRFNIPTGDKKPFNNFNKPQPVGNSNFDHCFQIDESAERVETKLISKEKDFILKVWQENSHDKFQFLQIFTPPGRRSIAIEPMTCCIDAFNNHMGLKVLNPGEKITGKFGISAGN